MALRLPRLLPLLFVLVLGTACGRGSSPGGPATPATWISFADGAAATASVAFEVSVPRGYTGPLFVEHVPFDQIGGGTFVGPRLPLRRHPDDVYRLTVSLPRGYVLRYRYARDADTSGAAEARFDSAGLVMREGVVDDQQVTFTDTVFSWTGEPPASPPIFDVPVVVRSGGTPVVDAVVSGPGGLYQDDAGYSRLALDRTDVEGHVVLHLPAGPARLVASEDGARFAQRGVVVAPENAEFEIELPPAAVHRLHVEVTAAGVPSWVELRLFGSTPALGFGYRQGYLANLRSATLRHQSQDLWSADVDLPEGGVDLFVSSGDASWGREAADGSRRTSFAAVVSAAKDHVSHHARTLVGTGMRAVTFEVSVPPHTPAEDVVTLLPNSLGSARIPMQASGLGLWRLFLPVPESSLTYKYIRTPVGAYWTSDDAHGDRTLSDARGALSIHDVIDGWTLLPTTAFHPPSDGQPTAQAPDDGFARGVALVDYWNPDMLPVCAGTLARLRADGVRWINLKPPKWGDAADGLPRTQQPEYPRAELVRHIEQLRAAGFRVYLMPQGIGVNPPAAAATNADDPWWDRWFAAYRLWILWFAGVAAGTEVEALSPFSAQSLPPAFIAGNGERWAALLAQVRTIYDGLLIPDGTVGGSWNDPIHFFTAARDSGWMTSVDGMFIDVGVRWLDAVAPLPAVDVLATRLDSFLKTFESFGVPIWMRLPTASVEGVLVDPSIVNADLPGFPGPEWHIDEDAQSRMFEAFFAARPRHPTLTGLYTWGFEYSATVDNGPSISGKRAEAVMRTAYLGSLAAP